MERKFVSRKDVQEVKVGLMLNSLTYAWLIDRLNQRGIITNKFTVSRIFSGSLYSGDVPVRIVEASKEIIRDYDAKINGQTSEVREA